MDNQIEHDYQVPVGQHVIEYEVKKSRFLACASRASSRDEALTFLAKLKAEFPDARHHCWAYLIGSPHSPVSVAMSDDGEPSGTAGKPILHVLQHSGVGDVMLVVVRYFGGIKLGAGGLVRAYSASAQQVMESIKTELKISLSEVDIVGDFALEQRVRHWLASRDGAILNVEYTNDVKIRIAIRQGDVSALKNLLYVGKGRLLDN